MASDFATQVKLACDDLYCDPFDHVARTLVRELLRRAWGGPADTVALRFRSQVGPLFGIFAP